MSQSYPYLTLARRLCLKYGHVLAIVDELDKYAENPDEFHYTVGGISMAHEWRLHNNKDFGAICEVWRGEQMRRRDVLANEDALSSDYHKSFVP